MSSPLLPGDPEGSGDVPEAVAMLVACHDKIRRFMETASRLAGAAPASDADVASTCAALGRYFTEALPRHAEDEDESLAPRLRATAFPAAVLDEMREEHAQIDALLAELLPAWAGLAQRPAARDELRAGLEKPTRALRELFDRHLAREEGELLPRLPELLGPGALDEIAREMRARRDDRRP